MQAYFYAGKPVTVWESANDLYMELEDGILCRVKRPKPRLVAVDGKLVSRETHRLQPSTQD